MSRRGKGRPAVDDAVAGIKRNDKGGILVDDAELKAAFEFFDVNSTGKITLSDLKVSNVFGSACFDIFRQSALAHRLPLAFAGVCVYACCTSTG